MQIATSGPAAGSGAATATAPRAAASGRRPSSASTVPPPSSSRAQRELADRGGRRAARPGRSPRSRCGSRAGRGRRPSPGRSVIPAVANGSTPGVQAAQDVEPRHAVGRDGLRVAVDDEAQLADPAGGRDAPAADEHRRAAADRELARERHLEVHVQPAAGRAWRPRASTSDGAVRNCGHARVVLSASTSALAARRAVAERTPGRPRPPRGPAATGAVGPPGTDTLQRWRTDRAWRRPTTSHWSGRSTSRR